MEINYSKLSQSEINEIKKQKKLNSKFNIRCKNAINDNNCFINVCFHSIIHFDKFIDFILNDNNFPIYSKSPKLILEIINLISSYKQLGNDKKNNNLIITPLEFRKALGNYYEKKGDFQLNSEGDPVELLNNILNFIHTYIASNYNNIDLSEIKCNPICIIHKLFHIDITETNNCNNCRFKNELKYDFNNFIYLINVESLFEIIQKNNLNYEKVNNKLFELTLQSISKSICSKCNNNSLNKIIQCNYIGNYFIINLVWESNNINLEKLLLIYCMINKEFKPNQLFNCTINKKYTFLGMIICFCNHYTCIYYDKTEKCFMHFDDINIKIYLNWKELLLNMLKNKYMPVAIFYENEEKENLKIDLREEDYNKYLKYCIKKDSTLKLLNENKLKENEWRCNCGEVNSYDIYICKNCKKKNDIIEIAIK